MKINFITCAIAFLLIGCGGQKEAYIDIPKGIESCDAKMTISINSFKVSEIYRRSRIPVFRKGKLNLTTYHSWGSSLKDIVFSSIASCGRKNGIWLTILKTPNSFNIAIERIWFDCDNKKAEIDAVINYKGKNEFICISCEAETPKQFWKAFEELAKKTIDLIKEKNKL